MFGLFEEGAHLLQASLLALVVGMIAEGLVDTGIRTRGMPLLCGLAGVYFAAWFGDLTGWDLGPRVAGHALLPAVLGTFGAAVFVKLVGLGMASARQ